MKRYPNHGKGLSNAGYHFIQDIQGETLDESGSQNSGEKIWPITLLNWRMDWGC
jgi:hypothetical protein